MLQNNIVCKKHWKPPFVKMKITIFLFLLCFQSALLQTDETTVTSETEIPEDGIIIRTESTAYSIRFYPDDADNYQILNVSCQFIKTMQDSKTDEQICDNLYPCSTYLAKLYIQNLNDNQITDKLIEAETDYAEPTVEIVEITTFVDKINITWSATDETCISNYQIIVKSAEKDKEWSGNDKKELVVDGLNPCQEHDIQVKSYNKNDELISNITTTSTTQYAEPEDVTVLIVPYENDNVKISWEQPKYKSCIRYYYLKWFLAVCPTANDEEETTCEWYANVTDTNAKEYVISDLQGCETYKFELYFNENRTSKCEQQQFASAEKVPGTVTLKTPITKSTNITLLWDIPQSHAKCLSHYELSLQGPMQRSSELQRTFEGKTMKNQYFFDELDPCGEYNFAIKVISLNTSAGEQILETYRTDAEKTTTVENVVVTPEPFSISLTWSPPNFGDLCVSSYRIAGWQDESNAEGKFDTETKDTAVLIENLKACLSYTIQIIPIISEPVYMDGALKHVEVETAATTPQKPINFQSIGVYPNGLELSSVEPDYGNKCETIFARFVCVKDSKNDVPYTVAEQYVEGSVGGISFKALISPLSPYTQYRCYCALFNIAGWSQNQSLIKTTEAYYPEPPQKIELRSSTHLTANFNWSEPKYPNGNIKLYITHFQRVEASYYVPPHCPPIKTEPEMRETSSLELSYSSLLPFTRYSIQIAAQNEYGVGEYTNPFMIDTEPWTSDPIQNLKYRVEGPYESDTEYKAYVEVSWITPCKSHGTIEFFELQFTGERADQEPVNFISKVEAKFNESGGIAYNETSLKPEYNYVVNVMVKTRNVETKSIGVRESFEAPAGIPRRFNESTIELARVNAYEANNPTNSAVVRLPAEILESETGTILYIAFLLSEKNCNPVPILHYGALNSGNKWPASLSWHDVHKSDSNYCIPQYQTTPLRWKPIPVVSNRIKSEMEIVYTIGLEKCGDDSYKEGTDNEENDGNKDFCNGRLKPDTEYHLVVRLFTKSGWSDVGVLQFKTDSMIPLALILISVISCLLFAFIAGFIYLWVTKRIIWHRESCHGIEDSFGDIISKNFAIFYSEISKPEKIAREFKELTTVAVDLSYAASELSISKNRYTDIYPYDKNRVILDIDTEGSDYINASFIDGYRRRKEYIATQGPKPESTMDFWRMVLQHNVRVIVMVTQFRELDIIKCHEYFPYKLKGVTVTVKKTDVFELYDRTEMSVSHEIYGLKQKVVHFYYKKWPDHGCPADPMNLITFVRKVKAERIPSYSPIVVHCSAGVGRTGTFIAVDIILQRLKSESKINIYETVKKLRFQRMKMVQTLTQYSFLYACAFELVKHKSAAARIHQSNTNNKNYNNNSNGIIISTGGKKVSFQDDAELNSVGNTLSLTRNYGSGRRNGSDLSSVDENGDTCSVYEDYDFKLHVKTPKDNMLSNGYGVKNIPIWSDGSSRKGLDIISLEDRYNDKHFEEHSNESAM